MINDVRIMFLVSYDLVIFYSIDILLIYVFQYLF